MLRTRRARTTCSTVRTASSSRRLTVAARNASGSTAGSIRRSNPASSSRRAKSLAVLGGRRGLDPSRLEPHERADELERLREGAVELPRVAPADPADPVGVDARLEQPHAGVDRGLAAPDQREAVGGLGEIDEPVGRDERDAGLDAEAGHVTRRDLRLDVRRVDDAPSRPDDRLRAVEERDDAVPVAVPAPVVAHAEEADAAGRQQVLVEDAGVVVADLGRARPLVEAGVRPRLVDAVAPERPRLDAVVRRRLVEAHERIGVQPVAAGPVAPVDEHDLGTRVGEQRVRERHPRRTRSDDEVVGLDLPHACEGYASRASRGPPSLRPVRQLLVATAARPALTPRGGRRRLERSERGTAVSEDASSSLRQRGARGSPDPLAGLPADERQVLAALAVVGHATLSEAQLAELAGAADVAPLLADLGRAGSSAATAGGATGCWGRSGSGSGRPTRRSRPPTGCCGRPGRSRVAAR